MIFCLYSSTKCQLLSTTVMNFVAVLPVVVFMLALLFFYATVFSVNKDLYYAERAVEFIIACFMLLTIASCRFSWNVYSLRGEEISSYRSVT